MAKHIQSILKANQLATAEMASVSRPHVSLLQDIVTVR